MTQLEILTHMRAERQAEIAALDHAISILEQAEAREHRRLLPGELDEETLRRNRMAQFNKNLGIRKH